MLLWGRNQGHGVWHLELEIQVAYSHQLANCNEYEIARHRLDPCEARIRELAGTEQLFTWCAAGASSGQAATYIFLTGFLGAYPAF